MYIYNPFILFYYFFYINQWLALGRRDPFLSLSILFYPATQISGMVIQ